jgi:protein SCO1/2
MQEPFPRDSVDSPSIMVKLPGGMSISMYAMIVIASVIIFGLVPLTLYAITPHYHGTVYPQPYRTVPAFSLPDVDGGDFTPAFLEGKVVIYYFGFTQCPDVCPTTLFELKRALEILGPRADEVAVVFISIDPDHDTPEIIRTYLDNFNEDFLGLYGDRDQLAPVLDGFGVRVRRAVDGDTLAPGISITHTNSMFAVDREGNLRLRLGHGGDPNLLARDIRYLLRDFPWQFWN